MGHKYIDVYCGRCNKRLTESWEDGWPNYGDITIGVGAQALLHLYGTDLNGPSTAPYGWFPSELHPTIQPESGSQKVRLQWSPKGEFRMCPRCQGELLGVIGDFFGLIAREK